MLQARAPLFVLGTVLQRCVAAKHVAAQYTAAQHVAAMRFSTICVAEAC